MPTNTLPFPRILRVLLIIVTPLCLLQLEDNPSIAASGGQKVDLTPALATGDLSQVKVQFELDGELKLTVKGKQPAKSPVQVNAQLVYDEKMLQVRAAEHRATSTVRTYETAEAIIEYREGAMRPQLRERSPDRRRRRRETRTMWSCFRRWAPWIATNWT